MGIWFSFVANYLFFIMKYLEFFGGGNDKVGECLEPDSDSGAVAVESAYFARKIGKLIPVAAIAFNASACGGNSMAEDSFVGADAGVDVVQEAREDVEADVPNMCLPVADCPQIFEDKDTSLSYWLDESRYARINPVDGSVHDICEPVPRNYCDEGEIPEKDLCFPPVCPNVEMCDPLLSIGPFLKDSYPSLRRYPDRANFPTVIGPYPPIKNEHVSSVSRPLIIDNMGDCGSDSAPLPWDSYPALCDPIPTCDETFEYCDPLPRCKEGQAPVTCTYDDEGLNTPEIYCASDVEGFRYGMLEYGYEVGTFLNEAVCGKGTGYDMPVFTINCLDTPECADGEKITSVTKSIEIDCGSLGKFTTEPVHTISCDPVKSCE